MELKEIKNIIEVNPGLILWVDEQKKSILIKTPKGMDIIKIKKSDWDSVLYLIKNEIKTRPNIKKRCEDWEAINPDGEQSEGIRIRLLNIRSSNPKRSEKEINERALNQLADAFKVPRYMGKIFLDELKLSSSQSDNKAKRYARSLGLMG